MRDAWSADRSERSPHGCSQIRMGDTGAVRNLIKAGEADLMQPSKTLKEWTPLHIACWGSIKPTSDKDLVEALLLWAQKSGKTNAMTSATECVWLRPRKPTCTRAPPPARLMLARTKHSMMRATDAATALALSCFAAKTGSPRSTSPSSAGMRWQLRRPRTPTLRRAAPRSRLSANMIRSSNGSRRVCLHRERERERERESDRRMEQQKENLTGAALRV